LYLGRFYLVAFFLQLHEMVEDSTDYPAAQFAIQNLGLFVGWLILLLLSIYEEDLVNSIG